MVKVKNLKKFTVVAGLAAVVGLGIAGYNLYDGGKAVASSITVTEEAQRSVQSKMWDAIGVNPR
ncbi:hypothetical protein [Ammoniphilus sp. YIM 78166]|uniref:hypothetical protein n=1 Tax=Ammoniphilus sp. YIM 78166 TaxID=1644106 RepID=UPI00106F8C42|nr:hypothetical protein [Ammoniphilus sp. YIM 78166]